MTKARASEAFDLLKQGREKEARLILEKIVHDDMADAAVLETLGDVREKLGDKAGAGDAYFGAVTHLRARGELRRALGVLELMLLVDDQSLPARLEGADIRAELEDFAGCWREVSAACDIFLSHGDVKAALALVRDHTDSLAEAGPALQVLKRLELHGAAQATNAMATGANGLAMMCVDLGNALQRRERHDDALALFARALELGPTLREAQHARAGGLMRTGRVAESRVVVDQILALDPHDLVALSLLERIAALLGDDAAVQSARDRFEKSSTERGGEHGAQHGVGEDTPWSEDTAELRPDTEDDPTDLER